MPKNAPMSYSNNVLMSNGGAILTKLNRYESFEVVPVNTKKSLTSKLKNKTGGYLNWKNYLLRENPLVHQRLEKESLKI